MSVIRINEFYAMPKKLNQLTIELMDILPKVRNTPGCENAEILTSVEGQEKVVIVEKWSSIEAHQDAAKHIDPRDFQKMLGLLKGKPTGRYYKATEY